MGPSSARARNPVCMERQLPGLLLFKSLTDEMSEDSRGATLYPTT